MPPPDVPQPGREGTQRSKREVLRILRRAGFPAETILVIEDEFPDPIDIDRDADALARYGITRGILEDTFGASP